jgi:hypothetical protein
MQGRGFSMAARVVLWASIAAASGTTVTVDETKADYVYDGHGALSAGASSRLLCVEFVFVSAFVESFVHW